MNDRKSNRMIQDIVERVTCWPSSQFCFDDFKVFNKKGKKSTFRKKKILTVFVSKTYKTAFESPFLPISDNNVATMMCQH